MSSRVTSSFLAAVLAVGLTAGASACQGNDPDPAPSAEGSESTGSESTESESTESESPAGSASPTVEPATGPPIEANVLTLNLSDGPEWIIESTGSVISGSHRIEEGAVDVIVSDLATTSTNVESNADAAWASRTDQDKARRLPNRMVSGVECWVFTAPNGNYREYDVGGVHNGYQFSIEFLVPADWAEADRRIEEILASVRWT